MNTKFSLMSKTVVAAGLTAVMASQVASAADAIVLPSGVKVLTTVAGKGESPKATDTVKVHYRGTLADGKEFDSSYKRNAPASFPLNRVIPCWTEGLQKMKVGGKATLTCPASTAYGDKGAGKDICPGPMPRLATARFDTTKEGPRDDITRTPRQSSKSRPSRPC